MFCSITVRRGWSAVVPLVPLAVLLLAANSPAVASAATATCQDVTATGGAFVAQRIKVKSVTCATVRPKLRSWTRRGTSSLPRGRDGWRCERVAGGRWSCVKRGHSSKVTFTVSRERVAPTIVLATPTQGAQYDAGATVTAAYTCADKVGVAKCVGTVPSGSHIATSEIGSHSFTVKATDKSGNRATKTVTYTVVNATSAGDHTAPTVNVRAPGDGATYKLGEIVRADYSCIDDVAVMACDGTVANGSPIATDVAGTQSVSVTAKDASGNITTKLVAYTVKDVHAPTITVTAPVDGASFDWSQSATAGYSCADDSKVVTCTATVANTTVADGAALPTTGAPGPGTRTLRVEATDDAGNVTTKDVHYTVNPRGYYALTYDDGPHSPATDCAADDCTRKLLDALASVNAKATFFLVGQNVAADPALVKAEADAGMTLGSHSYTHANLGPPDPTDASVPATVTEAQAASELQMTQTAIQQAAAVTPTFFRPPYGQYDAQTFSWLAPFGLALTAWTTDTNDWTGIDAATIARNAVDGAPASGDEPATSGVQPGGVILMHDNNARTVAATPLIVNRLRDEKGMLPGKLAVTATPQPGPYGGSQPAYYVEAVAP